MTLSQQSLAEYLLLGLDKQLDYLCTVVVNDDHGQIDHFQIQIKSPKNIEKLCKLCKFASQNSKMTHSHFKSCKSV